MEYELNNQKYNVIIKRKSNKNTYIRVDENKNIIVTTNYFVTNTRKKKILDDNINFLNKTLNKKEKKGFYLMGKKYDIIFDESINIEVENNIIKVKNEKVLNKKYVYILNNLLTETYDYKMIGYTSPTLMSISNDLDSKYAVKSGSTETDYWTIGYNKNYLMMVWAGNDDNDKVKARDSKITKKIWSKTITKIKTNKKEWYEIPKGITASSINPLTGEYKENGIVCFYEKGTEPNYIDKYSN